MSLEEQSRASAEELVEGHLWLVVLQAASRRAQGLTFDDFFSAGAYALTQAANKWRFRGRPFAAYARPKIRRAMRDLLKEPLLGEDLPESAEDEEQWDWLSALDPLAADLVYSTLLERPREKIEDAAARLGMEPQEAREILALSLERLQAQGVSENHASASFWVTSSR
jgi:RNA polymerase sigma factor (sigma-70 family)